MPWALALGAVALVAAILNGLVLWHRIERVELSPPAPGGEAIWLLVGSDRQPGASVDKPDGPLPGERADVVILVRMSADGVRVASLSRDLVLGGRDARPDRLATSFFGGAQSLVDLLCAGAGLAVDHLAIIDMAGLAGLVDAAGGITVHVDAATRDIASGLPPIGPGAEHLDGPTALAYARSRQAELFHDGAWRPDGLGDEGRVSRSSSVLIALMGRFDLSLRHPVRSERLAWRATGAVRISTGTSFSDVRRLVDGLTSAVRDGPIVDVPVDRSDGGVPVASLRADSLPLLAALGAGEDPDVCPMPGILGS